MLKIKLQKTKSKNIKFYRIIVIKNINKNIGKIINNIGYYSPIKKIININKNLTYFYINHGAQPTNTVRHLFLKYFKN